MNRIDETNTSSNTYNKKQVIILDTMKIYDHDIYEIIEEVQRRDKFDKDFDTGVISKCEYNKDSSENEERSSGESNNEEDGEL